MRFYADDKAIYSDVSVPVHLCGWNDIVHGGIISTILDEIMSWAALHFLKRVVMTRNMAVDFIKPIHANQPLKAKGQIREITGENSAALEGFITDAEGVVRAKSTANFAVFPQKVAKRLGIDEDIFLY